VTFAKIIGNGAVDFLDTLSTPYRHRVDTALHPVAMASLPMPLSSKVEYFA